MATVSSIVSRALQLVGVVPIGGTPSAEDESEGIAALNEMLQSWRNNDVDLGMGENLTSADTLYVDDSTLRAIRYNLAVDLSVAYPTQPRQDIYSIAESTKRALFAQYMNIDELSFEMGLTGRRGFNINNGY